MSPNPNTLEKTVAEAKDVPITCQIGIVLFKANPIM